MKLKKKNQLKKFQKNNSSQLGLSYQTHDLDNEIEITQ
jgi:hypothetical protein